MKVDSWIAYDDATDMPESFGGMGGWFNARDDLRHTWDDFLGEFVETVHPYIHALREAVVEGGIRHGGDWHQNSESGVPVFSDGSVARFTYRAWGDLLAAIWTKEDPETRYTYLTFYMCDEWGSGCGCVEPWGGKDDG